MQVASQHIKFQNSHNVKAKFDIIQLDQLLNRTDLDHNPCELHLVEFYIILIHD